MTKLNTYDVNLSRDTEEQITIRVKARNASEAQDEARGEAENNFDLDWNQTDFIGGVTVNQVDIVFKSRKKGTESVSNDGLSTGEARMTNVEVITSIMEYSNYGALAQAFVMDALVKFSKMVKDTPSEALSMMDNGLITCEAWKGVAAEIHDKLTSYHCK